MNRIYLAYAIQNKKNIHNNLVSGIKDYMYGEKKNGAADNELNFVLWYRNTLLIIQLHDSQYLLYSLVITAMEWKKQ